MAGHINLLYQSGRAKEAAQQRAFGRVGLKKLKKSKKQR